MTNYHKEKEALLRVFTNGGSVSPAQLKKVLNAAQKAGVRLYSFWFQARYSFPGIGKSLKSETICQNMKMNYELHEEANQNIMSSYVASGITASTPWVHSDTYHYILEDFNYQPNIKINLVDPAQKLVPLFTGNLNFIAAPTDNYWSLYLQCYQDEEMECCPFLVYSSQIAAISLFIEENLGDCADHKTVMGMLLQKFDLKESREELKIPENIFPYYEGFHKMTAGQHWLGLYWRNNQYDLPFMEAMCDLCAETNVGKIGITPWKSFIVKGIPDNQLLKWEKLLGKFGINTRHSSLELYWHTPVIDSEAMNLKRFLVRTFDQNDINTLGLSFTIKTTPMTTFSSIVIELNSASQYQDDFELFESFNIYHTKHFNPNEQEKIMYAKNVLREDLPAVLIQLSRHYYDQLQIEVEHSKPAGKKEKTRHAAEEVYQCPDCFTVYDLRYGDVQNGILPGLAFEELPASYACPLCQNHKENFQKVLIASPQYLEV